MSTLRVEYIDAQGKRDSVFLSPEDIILYQSTHEDSGLRQTCMRMIRAQGIACMGIFDYEVRE